MPVKDCTTAILENFWFENVVTRFGFPIILVSDQGTHFVNKMIAEITAEFHIQHKKTTPYHPQANGMVHIDFMDYNPASAGGHHHIIVVVDYFTKMVKCYAHN